MPINVCIFTTAHPLDDVRVAEKFAESFLQEGYVVTWAGPNITFHSSKVERPAIRYVLYPHTIGRLGRLVSIVRLFMLGRKLGGVDVYYCPDPDAALVASLLPRRCKAMVIFDVHEVFHLGAARNWLNGFGFSWWSRLIRICIGWTAKRCDLILGVNQSVLAPYQPSRVRSLIVRSCASKNFMATTLERVPANEDADRFVVMHGKADTSRGTQVLLAALEILHSRNEAHGLTVIMFKVGRIPLIPPVLCVYIQLLDPIPPKLMPELLGRCNVGLILYGRELGSASLPNRLFEYMATGLPTIAPSYSTEIASILGPENAGVLVDCERPEAVAGAINQMRCDRRMAAQMGRNARGAFLSRHNWEAEFLEVSRCITAGGGGPSA